MKSSPINRMRLALMAGCAAVAFTPALAHAQPARSQAIVSFDIPAQDLDGALTRFGQQSEREIIISAELTRNRRAPAVQGELPPEEALGRLLAGSGLTYRVSPSGSLVVEATDPQSSGAAGGGAEVEALIVTAQKREEDIQDVPIAISAFTQEALERSQVAGGPDLMTQVPNMTFTKTNFTTYSIQLRGIGTQAISATTDAAVAVAFNNTPFIRNRFFEQEFYDLQRVEVLRGPQGTLYGRNATAGVVNLISQKPKFSYEAKLSADVSNYSSTRLEGMINLPLVEDKVALRLAGAWTKREGFVTNEITGNPIDGRDLWSTRLSLRLAPTDYFDANLIWEHFQESDNRLRSGKQLCHQDDREKVGGLTVQWQGYANVYSQGCIPASLYSPDSFEAPNGQSLPYYLPIKEFGLPIKEGFNPYASLVQSPDLRVIESTVDPKYTAQSDAVELQWNLDFGNDLSLTSETAYNYDTIFSLQDYNRFNTASGAFELFGNIGHRLEYMRMGPNGFAEFCDPQVGCADRVVAVDVSRAKSSQFSQEFRLASDYDGAFNFSLGANFLRYDTEDKYYVFINTLTMIAAAAGWEVNGELSPYEPNVTDNRQCMSFGQPVPDPTKIQLMTGCIYIDPNPIENVNDQGHNYFLSRNPYKLISYAAFGEGYYQVADNLKITAGLRFTVDKKEAPRIPAWLLASRTVGSSVADLEEQEWREPTGRLAIDWKPDLPFTDQTLLYASFAHGYKAGGSNPPPSGIVAYGLSGFAGPTAPEAEQKLEESAAKPKTFDPEFVNAFEIGAKNTLLDGALTLNMAAFYYDYTGYQVSQIIDRSAVNYNFDAKVWGLELEADWRPLENLRLGFKGGYESTRVADGERAIDIMDRTAGHDDWIVMRPFPTFPSNCILPAYVVDLMKDGATHLASQVFAGGYMGPCEYAYTVGVDPATLLDYVANPEVAAIFFGGPSQPIQDIGWVDYPGFNPALDYGNNRGEGFFKELGGNELPNAPHFTATLTADYTLPLPNDWLATLHTDLYYQSEAWTRIFNMEGYDKLKAYTNVNIAAIFTNDDAGWKVMAYVKNVFDRDSITGSFLNSDDTGLTTNVFLTEPRLYGLRVTKEFTGGPWWTGANPDHTGPYPLTVELGGSSLRRDAPYAPLAPDFVDAFSSAIDPTATQNRDLDRGDGHDIRLTYRPQGSAFSVTAGFRYGKSNSDFHRLHATEAAGPSRCAFLPPFEYICDIPQKYYFNKTGINWSDSTTRDTEEHRIADFSVGKDFGLGLLGDGRSTISAGLRYAQLDSTTRATLDGVPNTQLKEGFIKYYNPAVFDQYRASITAERSFEGVGPAMTWDAARRLFGAEDSGHVDLDWSVSGGALFGKQKATFSGIEESNHVSLFYANLNNRVVPPFTTTPVGVSDRSTSVKAPFVDVSLGLSYEVQRFKIGAGYRWERYFNVLDAGYDHHQNFDRTIDGPYFKLAVGFGG